MVELGGRRIRSKAVRDLFTLADYRYLQQTAHLARLLSGRLPYRLRPEVRQYADGDVRGGGRIAAELDHRLAINVPRALGQRH